MAALLLADTERLATDCRKVTVASVPVDHLLPFWPRMLMRNAR